MAVASCYAPEPLPGAPCSSGLRCPHTLVCNPATMTCERSAVALDAAGESDAPTDACVTLGEVCGDGIDQDCDGGDTACPPNDTATGAVDVTAGGTFTADVRFATDDTTPTSGGQFCGTAGGRDVFYTVTIPASEIYYFDTFGSDYDTVIRIYSGTACTATLGTPQCSDNQCSTSQTQRAQTLAAGTSCIVIDQESSAVTAGQLTLHVERGNRTGTRFTNGVYVSGNSCNGANTSTATCGGAATDIGYFTTTCPGTTMLEANTCSMMTAFDSRVYVLGPSGELACSTADVNCATTTGSAKVQNVALVGAHLFWVMVDGTAATDCGTYAFEATAL